MARNVYLTAMEPGSGKSVVALGLMELLSRRTARLGFFRPVVEAADGVDNDVELVRRRFRLAQPAEELYAHTAPEARQLLARDDGYDALLKDVLAAYKRVEAASDVVVCEGTDFAGASSAIEFEMNADVANSLDAPVLAIVNGRRRSPAEIADAVHVAEERLTDHRCEVLAILVNRVAPADVAQVRAQVQVGERGAPTYVLPEELEIAMPAVGEIAAALGGRLLHGDEGGTTRPVRAVKVAAMGLPHFLDHVVDGTLVVTPGDRADIIVGSVAANSAKTYPPIAGLVLAGGIEPDPQITRLVDGLAESPFPIVAVDTDTYTTATRVSAVPGLITPDNDRKIAAALGLFEAGVDTAELTARMDVARSKRVTPLMFEYELLERARARPQRIVLPEGDDERILRAAEILARRGVADLVVLGDPAAVRQRASSLGVDLGGIEIVDPETSELRASYAEVYHELRRHKGITAEQAYDLLGDVTYFGTMLVREDAAGGMVSGAAHTTGQTIRPALEVIRTRPGVSIVSSVFLMCLADRVLAYGDCAVNPDPDASQLADIATSSADTAAQFGIDPLVAMLSYSTGASGSGADVDKVREATRLARERRPELRIEGPIQYDAAVDVSVARSKLPGSEVAGRATVFVFPDLNTGNNTYKAVQRSAGAVAIGPVLQGLRRPVNDLSRGCTVTDVVNTVAITAVQAAAGTADEG